MRPHLHPDMNEVVLCARVALQLTIRAYNSDPQRSRRGGEYARLALRLLPLDYPGFLRTALHSLGGYLDLDMPSAVWLSSVLEAAHFGHNFRRCFFFAYKENRSPYPRVTNRGVQTSKKGRQLHSRRGLSDE